MHYAAPLPSQDKCCILGTHTHCLCHSLSAHSLTCTVETSYYSALKHTYIRTYTHLRYTDIDGLMRLILFSLAISIHTHASMHVSQHCNAASGEYVNNLDENDASRRFSSQLTPLQHQEHISIAAVCVCVNEGQKDRLLVPKGKKKTYLIFMHTSWKRDEKGTHLTHTWTVSCDKGCLFVSALMSPLWWRRQGERATKQMTKRRKKKMGWHHCPFLLSVKSARLVSTSRPPFVSHTGPSPPSFYSISLTHTLSYPSLSPCAPQQSLNLLFAIFASRSWWMHSTQTRTNVHPWFQRTFARLAWNIYQCYCKSYLLLSW